MLKEKARMVGQKLNSFKYWPAVLIALLVLLVAYGAVQANETIKAPEQGVWEMPSRPWWPSTPVPEITIVAVEKNETVTIETSNFPEDKDFVYTMGFIYTRGKGGIVLDTINSGDGSSQELTFRIPSEFIDEYRIAIRAQTEDTFPYYAFNWFYNNDTNGTATKSSEEGENSDAAEVESEETASEAVMQTALAPETLLDEEDPVPSFIICRVREDDNVRIQTSDFPASKTFTVKMGVMPNYQEMAPYYDGKMKPWDNMSMGAHGKPTHPMPPMHPPGKEKSSKIWIPYYEAGEIQSIDGGSFNRELTIPEELIGAYRITILMYSDDRYPYYSYNWFYNNDADPGCEQ